MLTCATSLADTPHRLGARFCALNNAHALDAQYRTIASSGLIQMVEPIIKMNDAYLARYPDDKSPLGDGLGLTGVADHARCEVGKAAGKGARRQLDVTYRIDDKHDAGASRKPWSDRLMLVNEDGQWKVDDIRYASGGTLRQFLLMNRKALQRDLAVK